MITVKKEAEVAYTAVEMYQLVDGIEHYSQFLPWCKSTMVHSRTVAEVKASIQVAKGQIEHSFTTRNCLYPNEMIELFLIEGPFKHLQGCWRFEKRETGGSKVSLELDFEFSNKLVSLMIGPLIHTMANTFVDAFSERAKVVYGDRASDF